MFSIRGACKWLLPAACLLAFSFGSPVSAMSIDEAGGAVVDTSVASQSEASEGDDAVSESLMGRFRSILGLFAFLGLCFRA